MTTQRTLLVTGASGQLGHRVVELLASQRSGDRLIAGTRNPAQFAAVAGVEARRVDFDDGAGLESAFAGVDRLLIISTDTLDVPGHRLKQQRAAVAAAQRAGIKHIVYTSLPNPGPDNRVRSIAPDHHGTEEAILATGIEHTFLRNNMYLDMFLGGLSHAASTGTLFAAAGDGKVGFVTREDCARAAAAALASHETGSCVLDIMGPVSLSYAELASVLSHVTGKPVRYQPVSSDQQRQGLIAAGLSAMLADVLVQFDEAAAAGQLATREGAVAALTGTAPMSVRAFLDRERAKLM
jgi:NAD(P)H dehydrogenase (quinone)